MVSFTSAIVFGSLKSEVRRLHCISSTSFRLASTSAIECSHHTSATHLELIHEKVSLTTLSMVTLLLMSARAMSQRG